MKQANFFKRLLCAMLIVAILVGYALPGFAISSDENGNPVVTFTKVDNSRVSASLTPSGRTDLTEEVEYAATDVVRVSIILDKASTIEAGYEVMGIASNGAALAYRDSLKKDQVNMVTRIERALKTELDVVWNLTLAANIISANVQYGDIAKIEKLSGVKSVALEVQYLPAVAESGDISVHMATSGAQIGSGLAWEAGYTGAGTRIAVVDTGTDTNHQSLNAGAFEYALSLLAEEAGMSYEEYAEYLDLMTWEDIDDVVEELNVEVDPETAYFNAKLPFGFNYKDNDYDITHDNDEEGEHGSHVAGIATANSYIIGQDGVFYKALETVLMQGVAPEAQLLTMKVFGKDGSPYDSDYMAAIEDAIILGADVVNLSLGSVAPGRGHHTNPVFQAIMDELSQSGVVVCISAGNSGSWVENAENGGYLYATDVNMSTVGQPGSFTNSFCVASVENDGMVGYYVMVDGQMIVYNENLFNDMLSFVQIAGEYDYIFIDGVGTGEDWAAVADVLPGKVAICSRGETNFTEKARLAVDAGAVAVLIYNNTSGMINLDMTEYYYTAPVAALTQAQGATIREHSTPVTNETGDVLYFTGTMTISSTIGLGQFDSAYYTMSDFSSWGIPGSLEMKPEITAPGGNIFSLNGLEPSGGGYEIMSGTSMASPQVAGMSALLAQYIRENGLVEKTGLTERQLIHSLLMSTATPVLAGESDYYSVLQQGAGLANIYSAITADSYIMMAAGSSSGDADGKVKVELFDDPEKTGTYSATFTIYNLYDVEKTIALNADFFVQAPITDGTYFYMDTATALIGMDVQWSVNGEAYYHVNMDQKDFNGDGLINADDGQTLLDYATGIPTALTNQEYADLDGDGDIDSYDAYLFLRTISAGEATLPANGSVEITVEFNMTQDLKDTLDFYYPNGTYVQGFLYAETEETSHSIPVLGFYGNWTDPSMFDVGTWATYATEEDGRIPYIGRTRGNDFKVAYASEPDYGYSFGGNPLIPDEYYMPERDAINSNDTIYGVSFVPIRHADDSRVTIVNQTTGEILLDKTTGPVNMAYYYGLTGWQNSGMTLKTKVSLAEAAENDIISLDFTLVPEYYIDEEGNVNWEALGDGATIGTSMVIDNTAPELFDVQLDLENNVLTVTASDNQYIAAVGLYNKTGTRRLASTGAKMDIEKGEVAEYSFSLDGINGKKFLLQVFDYAMNVTTYMIETQIGEESDLPGMMAFDLVARYWTDFTKDFEYDYATGTPLWAYSDHMYYAATIAEHYVFAVTDEGDLYVMPEDDLSDTTFITNIGMLVYDMAYNVLDGEIYGINENNELVTIDKLSGEVTVVGQVGVTTNTLACDTEGTFYCNELGTGIIYSYTLETMAEPAFLTEDTYLSEGDMGGTTGLQGMEFNPNNGMLCWNSHCEYWGYITYAHYYEINPETGEMFRYNDFWHEMSCLMIPNKVSSGDKSWADPTTEVTAVKLNRESVDVIKDTSTRLTTNVMPWTAVDRTVTWTSADETVAVVNDKGVVTGVGEGTTVIRATSNLDPTKYAECTVNVSILDVTINGTVMDENGNSMFYSWNMATDETWTPGAAISQSITSATYSTLLDLFYMMDAGEYDWSMHKVDQEGNTLASAENPNGIPLWDMAYSEVFSQLHGLEQVSSIYYTYLLSPKDPMAMDAVGFDLSQLADYLVGITSKGFEQMEDEEGVLHDTEHLVLLDNDGYIWDFWIYDVEGGMNAMFAIHATTLNCEFPGDANMDNMYTSLMAGEDGNLYLSVFNGETNEVYHMSYDEVEEQYIAVKIGDMGENIWPATITSVTVNGTVSEEAALSPMPTDTMAATTITRQQLAAAGVSQRAEDTFRVTEAELAAKGANLQTMSRPTVGENEKFVTVEVTAEMDATNGVVTVTWAAENLVLSGIIISGDYTAKLEADGSVTFGYVALGGIPAGETLATLTFEVLSTTDTTVSIRHQQLNNGAGADENVDVEYPHANTEIRGAVEATCTESGYTGDTYCVDCGALLAEGEVVEAKGHQMGQWEVYAEATCTENGEERSCCAHCDYCETREILATDHSHELTETKEATCTEDGCRVYTCHCGDSYTEILPATGHNFVDGICQHCGEKDASNPGTGGESLYAVVLLALMSACAVAVSAGKRKV